MSQNNKSNFNQALWLGIGQLCTFAIAFFTAPILARYFDKVEYATYRQVLYVFSCIQALFTMGLPNVFVYFIPRLTERQQKAFINRLTFYFIIIGIVLSATIYISADIIADLLNNKELSVGLKIFSPFPLFTLPAIGVEGIYTAIRKTKWVAFYNIFSKTLMFLCIVLPVVIWHTGYKEAIIGWGVSSFITFVLAMYMKNLPYKGIEADPIPNIDRQIFSYALPLTGAFIAGFFVNSADQFFVSRYYGPQIFADFAVGCISIPIIGMVAGSVKGVLLPLFSKADKDGRLADVVPVYENAVSKTAIIVIPVLLFCVVFADDVIVALYGAMYNESGNYMRVHIIRDFMEILPYFVLLMAFGFSKMYMYIHIVGGIAILFFDFVAVSVGASPIWIVCVSSLFFVFARIVTFLVVYRRKGISFFSSSLSHYLIKLMAHCGIVLLALYVSSIYLPIDNVFLKLACIGICYIIAIILSGPYLSLDYLSAIKRLRKN